MSLQPYYEDEAVRPGPKRGYKQSPEHVAKRIRSGAEHPAWKGDNVSQKSARSRTQRQYADAGPCVLCGASNVERHHADGNTANNNAANIVILCRSCHMKVDGRLEALRELAIANHAKALERRWINRKDTAFVSGDACPVCSNSLSVTATRNREAYRLVYIGCRKSRGGCGFNGGSVKELRT